VTDDFEVAQGDQVLSLFSFLILYIPQNLWQIGQRLIDGLGSDYGKV